ITTIQWSKSLTASGYPARWNSRGNFVMYTAESRSLACLENLVHRSGEGNNALYKVLLIEIPVAIEIETLDINSLKKDWYTIDNYAYCQDIGGRWLNDQRSAVLKVPSVVIKKENNFLINPHHPEFSKIKLTGNEDFDFDKRF
ncbi:MAG: RES family NAD+ phosphorylase, partial [Ferruginibacter sp.]